MKQDYLQIRVLEVAPQVYACGPLFESDLSLLAKQGVRSILNTRPDDESPGQPASASLAKAAEEYGIKCAHFPVVDARSMSDETKQDFAQVGTVDELHHQKVVVLFLAVVVHLHNVRVV